MTDDTAARLRALAQAAPKGPWTLLGAPDDAEPQPYDIRILATKRSDGIDLRAVLHAADGTPLVDFGPAMVSDGATFTIAGLKIVFDASLLVTQPTEEDWRRWCEQVTVDMKPIDWSEA